MAQSFYFFQTKKQKKKEIFFFIHPLRRVEAWLFNSTKSPACSLLLCFGSYFIVLRFVDAEIFYIFFSFHFGILSISKILRCLRKEQTWRKDLAKWSGHTIDYLIFHSFFFCSFSLPHIFWMYRYVWKYNNGTKEFTLWNQRCSYNLKVWMRLLKINVFVSNFFFRWKIIGQNCEKRQISLLCH